MSDFTLEIFDTTNTIEIETSTEDNTDNIEITTTNADSVEITTGFAATVVYASDIVGLDNYLSNFIDSYNIDCGTP
jgi:chaperonin GroEL (HSP60 family)